MADDEWSLQQIAHALLLSEDAIYQHIQDYKATGKRKPENGGSVSKLNTAQANELRDCAKIGKPTACRACAQACGKTPVPLVIPCHRVINKNNNLGGYNKGIGIKQALLFFEKMTSM